MLRTGLRRHRSSALTAQRAAREAQKAASRGLTAVAGVVLTHQVAQAATAERAVEAMLAEQGVTSAPAARLNPVAFTTPLDMLTGMAASAGPSGLGRLVTSLVQDAGRAAESVAIASRPRVGWVRQLTPPSCSRCAVLAGRVYRYSDGFLRHPGDDCVTVPVAEADDSLVVDPATMVRNGQIRGLSKADQAAVLDGADLGQVVNVRRSAAGLTEAGQVLARAGRPTPAGIYRMAGDRDEALSLLERFGYVL